MEPKHMPGKWEACGSESNLATWVEDETGKRVCTMKQAVDDWDRARLIAQAPDLLAERDNLRRVNAELLAALAYMVSSVLPFTGQDLRDTSLDVAIKTARAAIAHAEEK